MFRGFVEMHRHTIPLSELNKTYGCDICDEGDWHSETEVDIHKRINHRSDLKAVLNDDNSCTVSWRLFLVITLNFLVDYRMSIAALERLA